MDHTRIKLCAPFLFGLGLHLDFFEPIRLLVSIPAPRPQGHRSECHEDQVHRPDRGPGAGLRCQLPDQRFGAGPLGLPGRTGPVVQSAPGMGRPVPLGWARDVRALVPGRLRHRAG